MSSFADRLKHCLHQHGASQADLARHCDVSSASVSDWMRGVTAAENIKAEPLLRAAAFLSVNPMWLLTGRGQREPQSPTVLTAAEPGQRGPAADWPFAHVPPAQYYRLPEAARSRIEGMVDGLAYGSQGGEPAQPSGKRAGAG